MIVDLKPVCVLLSLVNIVDIVVSSSACSNAGRCPPSFFCHTGLEICMSCDQCSAARGNLQLCENECFRTSPTTGIPHGQTLPPTGSERTLITITLITTIVAVIVISATIAACVICYKKKVKRTDYLRTGVEETGETAQSMFIPTCTENSAANQMLLTSENTTGSTVLSFAIVTT